MIVLVTSAISFLFLAVIFYQVFRSVDERKDRTAPILPGAAVLTMCAGLVTGSMCAEMLMIEIMPSLAGMMLSASAIWERGSIRPAVLALAGSYLIPLGLHVAAGLGCGMPSHSVLLSVFLVSVLVLAGVFMSGIVRRLKNVKAILKTGTIWVNVSLSVDVVYMVMFMILALGFVISSVALWPFLKGCQPVFPFLAGLMTAALGVRIADDVLFVFWRNQERRIIESMKVTKVETAMDPAGIDDVYQDIYERIVAYFESEKPFLDNELTINDLVKVLYSNKLYISRAISQFTGRNFCQFVNYYRVTYSMELFRQNNELKIHELACGSGFNSDVSYNMAFRLFMGETPGEWCRKERSRKIKMKK